MSSRIEWAGWGQTTVSIQDQSTQRSRGVSMRGKGRQWSELRLP